MRIPRTCRVHEVARLDLIPIYRRSPPNAVAALQRAVERTRPNRVERFQEIEINETKCLRWLGFSEAQAALMALEMRHALEL